MKKNSSTKELKLSNNERLFLESSSIFDPKKYDNLLPDGIKVYTFNSGFKKKLDDLLIIVFDKIATSINLYSKTSTPSAPIIWDRKNNRGKIKALIINSGNANAHTGDRGIKIIDKYVRALCKIIKCKKSEVLVSSTGVIGELFDPELIIKQIIKLKSVKNRDLLSAAKTIMTTDTYPKTSIRTIKINKNEIRIYGIAKGSGMIMPNMGTMLAYIFIEAKVPSLILNKIIKSNLDDTFNSISVDTDTSTSDTLLLISLDKFKLNFYNKKNYRLLNSAIYSIMKDLSLKVVKDGEGLSKLIQVKITEAKTKLQAKNIGLSIINSPLVKTAISGEDANWGRIIMAIGKTEEKIKQNKITIHLGENLLCKNGSVNKKINTKKLDKYMKNKIIQITVSLDNGRNYHTVYGNDLTQNYIKINSDYRS